jgi:hypothetical protein
MTRDSSRRGCFPFRSVAVTTFVHARPNPSAYTIQRRGDGRGVCVDGRDAHGRAGVAEACARRRDLLACKPRKKGAGRGIEGRAESRRSWVFTGQREDTTKEICGGAAVRPLGFSFLPPVCLGNM